MNSREAFAAIHKDGFIESLSTFSFLVDYHEHLDASRTLDKIVALIKSEKPDLVFWQKLDGFPITDNMIRDIRAVKPGIKIAYHEGDPYGKFYKRFDRNIKCMLSHADYVFWCGIDSFLRMAKKYGARKFYYLPHNVDLSRFWNDWVPTQNRDFDLVMIANGIKSKLPFLSFPGSRRRYQCVKLLTENFGQRFAVYGCGWEKYLSSKGPVPFKEQTRVLQSARISVNWDHFDKVGFYNSDRTVISLASGVPHITTYHPGFEYMYRDVIGKGLYLAKSPGELVDIAVYLLSKPNAELIEEGQFAKKFAFDHYRSELVFKKAITNIIENPLET
ncbi:MAG TPA: hypothetical protein VK856_02685 [Anaerolineaceae bacterium]|nr:hypothetical protein [Anaerolineaceae bacterium]